MQPTLREIFLDSDPVNLPTPLRALWYAGHHDWTKAHEIAQAEKDRHSAWVHAYLNRQEGDEANAAYWFRQAGKPVFQGSSEEEWMHMVESLQSI